MAIENQELRKAGLKVTLPRVKIYQILEQADAGEHFSAEDIYKLLMNSGEDVGLATVYRVLTQFEAAGFIRSKAGMDYPDIQFHFWPYFLEGWSPPPEKDGYCFDVGPTKSKSLGSVRLRSSDPFAKPRIRLNALSQEKDFEDFRTSIRIARDIAGQNALDFCRGDEVVPGPEVKTDSQIDEYVRDNANSAYHPAGTAKMGKDRMSVCDPLAKVHGIERLRIADASIMPTVTNGNINAPCMMIGEKVASMIVSQE